MSLIEWEVHIPHASWIFTYMYHKIDPTVGKHSPHGACGYCNEVYIHFNPPCLHSQLRLPFSIFTPPSSFYQKPLPSESATGIWQRHVLLWWSSGTVTLSAVVRSCSSRPKWWFRFRDVHSNVPLGKCHGSQVEGFPMVQITINKPTILFKVLSYKSRRLKYAFYIHSILKRTV